MSSSVVNGLLIFRTDDFDVSFMDLRYASAAATDLLKIRRRIPIFYVPWRIPRGDLPTERKDRAGTPPAFAILDNELSTTLPLCQSPISLTLTSHLYLWRPNALLPEGLAVMKAWGFNYKSNLVWHKVRKDGGYRWARRRILFSKCHRVDLVWCPRKKRAHVGTRAQSSKFLATRKREHSRKPDEQYKIIQEHQN